jgi:A-kinase anchor protein 10
MLSPALLNKLLLQTETLDMTLEMFDPLLDVIREEVQVAFASFLLSPFFLKYQIDIMTKGHITLSDVLFDDGILFYFLDFMEQEGMRKYADFLLIIHSYQNADPGQVDIQVIWETFRKFFEQKEVNAQQYEESTHCLHFSDHVCRKVRDKMLHQQTADCFDFPARVLHQYLEKTYFRQFLESQAYFDMTTEWIKRFQRMQLHDFPDREPKRTSMDLRVSPAGSSTSDPITDLPSSQTDNNTGTSVCHEKRADEPNIWDRSRPGLQILHVDRYGRVISDLEPEPDKRQEMSNISMSIRKLVGRSVSNQDSNEALAWKAAQAIVDDVLSITQSS